MIKWGTENSDAPHDLENFSSEDFSNLEESLRNLHHVDNCDPAVVFIKIAELYEIIGGYNPVG